ncbi:TTC28 [Branchiostoma lanceolatum]|uniref:TTC28 protein n=1 Tax=Branchiostoma lanceolatum TaxID=7740 RepID=A0A8J9Z9M3_BRALA|nr:TTC28 [Branchiostoma lanceolatum]
MKDKAQQFDLYCQIGDLYRTKLHNLQSALQYYQNMLECSQALSEDTKQAKAYNRLGLTCDMAGEHQEACYNNERALAIYRDIGGKESDICVAHKSLASSLALSGQVSDAKTNYESALAVAMKTGNKTEQIDIYCKLGDLHRVLLDKPKVSKKYYTEMLELARELGRKEKERLACNRLGLACEDMQDNEAALDWHQKHLKMSQEDDDTNEHRIAHTNVGNAYRRLGKLDQATSHFNTALQMAQQTGDQHGQMKVYYCMGDMHKEQLHSPRTAIQYYEQHLALAKQLGDTNEEGLAYNRLGRIYCDMGKYEVALEWDKKDLKIRQYDGDKKKQRAAHTNVGNTYRLLGKLDRARSHFNTALLMAKQIGDLHEQMKVYFWIGEMHRKQLDTPRTAIQYYEKHLALARQLTDKHEEGLAYNKLGLAHSMMGEHEVALERFKKYLKIRQSDGDTRDEITALTSLGDTYCKLRNFDKAASHLKTALHIAQQTEDQQAQIKIYSSMCEMQKEQLNTPAVIGDKSQQFDLYCQIGDLYRTKLHNLQSALQYYQNMLECSQALSDDTKQAKAYSRLGMIYDMLGKQWTAFTHHKRALSIHKVRIHTDVCEAYKNLASSLAESGQVSDAKTYYESALAVAMETGKKTEQMNIYCLMGDLHRTQLDEPQIAHIHYIEMKALARDFGRKEEEMLAYNRLGLACEDMQDYEAALEWHQKALKMRKEAGDTKEVMVVHICVGDTYKDLGNFVKATSHFSTALQMAQQTGDQSSEMTCALRIGDLHREQLNSPHTAIQYYKQYLALAKQLGRKEEERQAYNRLGLACYDMGDYEADLGWSQKYLKMSQEAGDKGEVIDAHMSVCATYQELGNFDKATSHYSTALQMAQQTENQDREMACVMVIGDMHRKQLNSPHTAIQYYEQALALAKQLGRKEEERQAYNRLGLACYNMQDYEADLGWLQKYLKMSQEAGDKGEVIGAHMSVGATYKELGNFVKATSHYNTALQMAQQTGDKSSEIKCTLRIGDMHREQLHSPQTAIQYYEQALALARQLKDRHKEMEAYNSLGRAHHDMGEYKKALEWFQKHLKMSQDDEDEGEQITAHRRMGNTNRFLGQLDEATSHFNTALQMAQQTGDQDQQMYIHCEMGDMHLQQLHTPHTAIQYYEQYLALAKQLKNKHVEAVAYNRLGLTHNKMAKYEAALEWHQKDLKMIQDDGNNTDLILTHAHVGHTYSLLGKLDQAKSHFNTASQMVQQTGYRYGQMRVDLFMGDMHREQLHSPRKAIQYYEQYLVLARQMMNRRQEGRAYKKLGKAHYEMGEYKAGLEWFEKYLKISQECGDKTEQITAHKHIAESYKAQGKLDLARSHCQTAMDIAMETGNKQAQNYIAEVVAGL